MADDESGDLDFDQLADIEINGREIRTVIRLVCRRPADSFLLNVTSNFFFLPLHQALALARCEGVALNAEHIKRTVAISQQFGKDLSSVEDW